MSVEFTFDGRPMAAQAGQTVGAALLAEGIRSWRTTRFGGRPRGLFCGIGVCFDCLVTVNGEPNVRACLAVVAEGDVVRTQVGYGRGGALAGAGPSADALAGAELSADEPAGAEPAADERGDDHE